MNLMKPWNGKQVKFILISKPNRFPIHRNATKEMIKKF